VWLTPNPLRCARGAIATQTLSAVGVVALFNSSGSSQLIVVWNIATQHMGGDALQISVQRNRLTNQNAGVISPVLVDESAPPGQIDWDNLAAAPDPDYYMTPQTGDGAVVPLSKPIAVLRPGWSLVVCEPTSDAFPVVSFYWEWCWPQDLHTPDPFASNNLP
jgi:hypothetical protein